MVSNEQVKLVKDSWAVVCSAFSAEDVAGIFYNNLFSAHPEAKGLFENVDMKVQRVALIGMIDTCVKNLENTDTLVANLKACGVRHSKYGCIEVHYDYVGEALILTLSQGLKDKFTPATKEAWISVYGVIKSTMWGAQQTPEGKRLYQQWLDKKKQRQMNSLMEKAAIVGLCAAAVGLGLVAGKFVFGKN